MDEVNELNGSNELNTNQEIVPEENPVQGNPALLLVRGKNGSDAEYIRHLSNACLTVLQKYGFVYLKCVGAASVNNAVKAIIVASGEARKRGVNAVCVPSFQVANFDGEEKTAILFQVIDR